MADERTVYSFCRICTGQCATVLEVDGYGRITDIKGDRDHPQTLGYACLKGLQAVEAHYGPQRILHPLKRMPDGQFQRIPLETALDEIADRLQEIIGQDGGEAVAGYKGSGAYYNAAAAPLLQEWLRAIGSAKFFSSLTIDQSAKVVAMGRMGIWPPGKNPVPKSDLLLLAGTNPLVSVAAHGVDPRNVSKRLRQRKQSGRKLIVIDPRLTETARMADIVLQPLPGEDAAIFAGLLHIVLNEGWHDREFCDQHVGDLQQLKDALKSFTPDYVARRAGVPAGKLREVAQAFACHSRTGTAWTGTGTDMGPHSNLAEHLAETLNVVCGRMLRAGEKLDNPGVMAPPGPLKAMVIPAGRPWEQWYKSRIGGQGLIAGELPCGIMADEILEPGPGRVRAFINHGGNPASAVPGQKRAVEALRALDLLVSIEPFMTATAQLSHYILPPTLQYERPDLPLYAFERILFPTEPFMRYTPQVAKPPAGSEVADDGYLFWSLAKRLGVQLDYLGVPLDMTRPPVPDDLLGIACQGTSVTLKELKQHPRGHVFDVDPVYVQPADEGWTGRFTLAPPDVVAELEVLHADYEPARGFTHRLAVRRLRETNNTTYRDMSAVKNRVPYNLAYINPADLAKQQVAAGERITITSPHGSITAQAEADDSLRQGVISIAHGFGALPGEGSYDVDGSCTNLLLSLEQNRQAINAMPEMTGVPLKFEKNVVKPAENPGFPPEIL